MRVVFTSREIVELFEGNEGKQVLNFVTKQGYGNREYQIDGRWYSKPNGNVAGIRYNLKDILKEIENLANTWKYIKEKSIESPEGSDRILEQLALSRLAPKKLKVFSPWGPRYNRNTPKIEENCSEIRTLREIRRIFGKFREEGYDIDFLLMPADAYGTEVNGLDKDFVEEYFKYLEETTSRELDVDLTIKPWSSIREEQQCRYDKLRREVDENFSKWIKEGEYQKAVRVAKRFNPSQAEESARKYCIERLVEGNIINEIYNPLKLSLVRKEKDSLDGPLRRIYMVQNKAPWLGGE